MCAELHLMSCAPVNGGALPRGELIQVLPYCELLY